MSLPANEDGRINDRTGPRDFRMDSREAGRRLASSIPPVTGRSGRREGEDAGLFRSGPLPVGTLLSPLCGVRRAQRRISPPPTSMPRKNLSSIPRPSRP
jgi:hypothetical protein